jgi:hypothetical protein
MSPDDHPPTDVALWFTATLCSIDRLLVIRKPTVWARSPQSGLKAYVVGSGSGAVSPLLTGLTFVDSSLLSE